MTLLETYLENPCGTLSIPYWKHTQITLPEHLKIVHQKEFDPAYFTNYADEPYFRLFHSLKNIGSITLDNFFIKTATQADIPIIAEIINRSYSDLSVTYEQLLSYTSSKVYDKDLWVIVYARGTESAAGCGIAELDKEIGEGILEWIQVLPEYRGQKIGQFLVTDLLGRLSGKASFATVSGKVNNPTHPEQLYRKCGFTGNDIWHILSLK